MLPKLSSRPASPPAGLLSSTTRIDPGLRPPASHCCRDGKHRSEYETCPDDPRGVRRYAARKSIAISRGQNDSGMFEQQQISGSESAKLCRLEFYQVAPLSDGRLKLLAAVGFDEERGKGASRRRPDNQGLPRYVRVGNPLVPLVLV